MAFIDECVVLFKAGNGGNGIVAWRREAHVPMGGPAGGNGGKGGDIILVGNHNINSLQDLYYLKKIVAKNGNNGEIKTMHGANADNVYVKVPVGTMVFDNTTNELIADIDKNGMEFTIVKGGIGGYGNFHFKSSFNKAPSLYELGDLGEIRECKLVLKQIADVGIIGLPNAGKSTFISNISNAKPKTANYEFTTLSPILGTVKKNNMQLTFADIPGLIEGASQGHGLGHNFLRHIERTKVLIHIISMDENDVHDPIKAYQTIMNELKIYSPLLMDKKMIIVCNKMDAVGAEEKYQQLLNFLPDKQIFKTIAALGENLDIVVEQAYQLVRKQNTLKMKQEEDITFKVNLKTKFEDTLNKNVIIKKEDEKTWNVECEFLKYWSHKIPLNTQDNIVRFNQKMQTVEVEKLLKEMGAKKGDTIKIYNIELECDN